MVDSKSPVNSSRTRDTRADSKVAANVQTSSNKTLASVASSTAVKAEEITSVNFARREMSFQIPRSVGGFFFVHVAALKSSARIETAFPPAADISQRDRPRQLRGGREDQGDN